MRLHWALTLLVLSTLPLGCNSTGPSKPPQVTPKVNKTEDAHPEVAAQGKAKRTRPAAAPAYVRGIETPYLGRFSAVKELTDRLDHYEKYRQAAVEALAIKLGLVYPDKPLVIYLRLWDQPAGELEESPEVSWGGVEWKVVDGRRRPLVTLHAEPILARQVTLRELISFEITRGALIHLMGAEYYQLPAWLRLGAAYYAADRGKTLIRRALARLLPTARDPQSLLIDFDDDKAETASKGLLGYLALRYLEVNHGVAALKSFINQIVVQRNPPDKAIRGAAKLQWGAFKTEVHTFGKRLLAERSKGLFPVYRKILKQYVAGRDSLAIGQLNSLIEKHRHAYVSGNALYRLGRAYYKRRAYEEAHRHFEMIWLDHARTSPFLDRAIYWAGRCRLDQKRRKEAVSHFQKLRTRFPHSSKLPSTLTLTGSVLTNQEQLDAAYLCYLEFLQRFPKHPDAPAVALELGRNAMARHAYFISRRWCDWLIAASAAPNRLKSQARQMLTQLEDIESAPLPAKLEQEINKLAGQLLDVKLGPTATLRLREIGPAAAPALGRMLARAQPELHRVLLRLLAEMANPRAAHHLILRLPRVDKSTRKELLKVMIRMGVPADLLPDMLESTGLPKSITAEVKGMLGELTFHTTPQVRAKLPSLVSQLNHPSGMERLKGLRALNQLQDPGGMRALMVLATSDKEPQIRRESMEGLAVWGDQEATPTFIEALGDESPYIRQLALQLVARYRTSGALPTVRTLLKDKQATVRSLAYHAVALLGADKEIPLLVDGIRDKSFEVRQATMDSLMTMNQKMVVRHLLPMAQGTNGPRLRGRVFRFLARLTQLNLGYYPEATPTQRRQMLGRVQTWLKRSQ